MINAVNLAFKEKLNQIFHGGHVVSPRGKSSTEILAAKSIIPMDKPILTLTERELGYRFQAAEAAWIISGKDDVKSISPYSKQIAQFSDDGEYFFGAYGPKITAQLPYVIGMLAKDLSTRQAVINIWRESPQQSKDIPCTLSLQFMIRESRYQKGVNVLYCIASMRSSDIWLGWPYDIFNFSSLACFIAIELRALHGIHVRLGNLFLTAGSQHLYETNSEAARKIILNRHVEDAPVSGILNPQSYISGKEFVMHLWTMAESEGTLKGLTK